MFDKIVESVLNEIKAKDAYTKYYSKIPRDDFFRIVETYFGKNSNGNVNIIDNLKFDKLLTFIFNCVLKGDLIYEASMLVKKYKSVPNEVRIAFLNEFNAGKFEDIDDMAFRLESLEKNGVQTLASFYKDGLIVVEKTDEWTFTCTTTYEANHHYFGNTRWCTASDRLGEFDGWLFFQRYIFDDMEYNPNGLEELGDLYTDYSENDDEDDSHKVYPPEAITCTLIQFTKADKSEIYQAHLCFNGDILVICNEEDGKVSDERFNEIIPIELQLSIKKNAKTLVEKTRQSFIKENEYQESKNEYIRAKKIKIERRKRELINQLTPIVEEEQEKKFQFVTQKSKEFLETNLLTNKSFIETVCKNNKNLDFNVRNEEKIALGEEILKSQYYIFLSGVERLKDDIFILKFSHTIGELYVIGSDQRGKPCITKELSSYCNKISKLKTYSLIVKCSNLNYRLNYAFPKISDITIDAILFKKIRKYEYMDEFVGGNNYYDIYNNEETRKIVNNYYVFSDYDYYDHSDGDSYLFSLENYSVIRINHRVEELTYVNGKIYALGASYKKVCTCINLSTKEQEIYRCELPEKLFGNNRRCDAFVLFDSPKLHVLIPKRNIDIYFNVAWKINIENVNIDWIQYYGQQVDNISIDLPGFGYFNGNVKTGEINNYDERYFKPIN